MLKRGLARGLRMPGGVNALRGQEFRDFPLETPWLRWQSHITMILTFVYAI